MDRYELRVSGYVTLRRAKALGCDSVRLLSEGESELVLDAPDAAALYGHITAIGDAGLVLLSLRRATPPAVGSESVSREGPGSRGRQRSRPSQRGPRGEPR